jgi:hypothetical protein
MDIGESDDAYLFRVSLPGVSRDESKFVQIWTFISYYIHDCFTCWQTILGEIALISLYLCGTN